MAEAEDVLVDAARHATLFARQLWARHRPERQPDALTLASVSERLAMLVQAAFGMSVSLRVAQQPAPLTLLARVFRRRHLPRHAIAVPATDGAAIWLPRLLPGPAGALDAYRCMALSQAARIARGSARGLDAAHAAEVADLYLLLEAAAAERQVARLLPGMRAGLEAFRRAQLARRPPLQTFPPARRALEALARGVMQGELPDARIASADWSPLDSLGLARSLAARTAGGLFRDLWTGELRPPGTRVSTAEPHADPAMSAASAPRTARLVRRPEVRAAQEGEDEERAGAWMIQTSQPAETAEDPLGMQRPADLDQDAAADEYADSVSELGEARLVSTPERAREILLSDDPPEAVTRRASARDSAPTQLSYPEWDYRVGNYRHPGATVRLLPAAAGSQDWVERTMREHHVLCTDIRRRFEMLRAQRQRNRRTLDGDDIDIDACVEARADVLAGLPMSQNVYQRTRLTRRDMAITLLVDISGSTDAWISDQRRVIDVEREALLLVCHALEALGEPYSVLAFSGEGRDNVVVREIKAFTEPLGAAVALRIAALEPEHYTRAGAALRHAATRLMQRGALHRLLLVLSDGKPNDNDEYDGTYGAEDMRQSVSEARLQGIFPFCLTIDRQAAEYLPRVFGAGHYALLHRPERLPAVLLEWMRRLVAR
jgi:nitric oxide reductase NorD protein